MLRREVYLPGESPNPSPPRLVDAVVQFALGALALTVVFYGVVLLFAAGCGVVDDTESAIKGVGADLAELSYCEVEACGEVFLCTMADGTKNEWCWEDDSAAELELASGASSCSPTPRGGSLGWPCLYQCPSAKGCNAYAGCRC